MKVWRGFGSEHSANLVIIGHFESSEDAAAALDIVLGAARVALDDEQAGRLSAGQVPTRFSEQMLDYLRPLNMNLTYADLESLLYDFNANVDGKDLVITTEEQSIGAFMTMLVDRGARIEVYSAHLHPSKYGRQTYSEG